MKITQDFLEVEGNQNANENENYARFLRSGRKPKRERKNRKLLGFGNGHFSSQWRKIPEYLQI